MDRKFLRVGFLFVAPDGMDEAAVAAKRWQRRFFVLWDDGQLTYSIDQHVGFGTAISVNEQKQPVICSRTPCLS